VPGDLVDERASPSAFAFGKLPAHGDFISRGLDDAAVEAGDAAVASAVALASERWDTLWDDVYVETPVWRFTASPGVIGQDWTAGVFMASVDAVGRQFPLVAGFAVPSLDLLGRSAGTAQAIERVEAIIRDALLEAHSIDAVMERLAGALGEIFGAPPPRDPVAAFAQDMLGALDARPWTPQSTWWIAGSDDPPLRLEGALSGEGLAPLFRRNEAPPPPADVPETDLQTDGPPPATATAVDSVPASPSADEPAEAKPPQDNTPGSVISSPGAEPNKESGGAHEDAAIPHRT